MNLTTQGLDPTQIKALEQGGGWLAEQGFYLATGKQRLKREGSEGIEVIKDFFVAFDFFDIFDFKSLRE